MICCYTLGLSKTKSYLKCLFENCASTIKKKKEKNQKKIIKLNNEAHVIIPTHFGKRLCPANQTDPCYGKWGNSHILCAV